MKNLERTLVFAFLMLSCSQEEPEALKPLPEEKEGYYTGYNYRGNPFQCVIPSEDRQCALAINVDSEEYAARCEKESLNLYDCGCRNFLCSGYPN